MKKKSRPCSEYNFKSIPFLRCLEMLKIESRIKVKQHVFTEKEWTNLKTLKESFACYSFSLACSWYWVLLWNTVDIFCLLFMLLHLQQCSLYKLEVFKCLWCVFNIFSFFLMPLQKFMMKVRHWIISCTCITLYV